MGRLDHRHSSRPRTKPVNRAAVSWSDAYEERAKYKQQLQDWTAKEGVENARRRVDRNIKAVIEKRGEKFKEILTLEQLTIAEQRKIRQQITPEQYGL
jgi:hypothetical protein